MEVHHHTHTAPDPDPSTSLPTGQAGSGHRGRKKWTHYLWEFLMLFLAVFCGFLAENQREHFVEKHRAKEYAKSFLNDLTGDTIKINAAIQYAIWAVSSIDTLQQIADSITNYKTVPGRFYYYSSLATLSPFLDWNMTSLNQIINSGNIRYFKNTELVKKISDYVRITLVIDEQLDQDRAYRQKSRELRNEVLISRYFSLFSSPRYQPISDSALKQIYPIQATNPGGLENFLNSYQNRKAILYDLHYNTIPTSRVIAIQLIELLKKEFHFK